MGINITENLNKNASNPLCPSTLDSWGDVLWRHDRLLVLNRQEVQDRFPERPIWDLIHKSQTLLISSFLLTLNRAVPLVDVNEGLFPDEGRRLLRARGEVKRKERRRLFVGIRTWCWMT